MKRAIPIYFLLSIPGIILLYIWGGSVYIVDGQDKVDFIQSYHHPRFIFKNLIIFFIVFILFFTSSNSQGLKEARLYKKSR